MGCEERRTVAARAGPQGFRQGRRLEAWSIVGQSARSLRRGRRAAGRPGRRSPSGGAAWRPGWRQADARRAAPSSAAAPSIPFENAKPPLGKAESLCHRASPAGPASRRRRPGTRKWRRGARGSDAPSRVEVARPPALPARRAAPRPRSAPASAGCRHGSQAPSHRRSSAAAAAASARLSTRTTMRAIALEQQHRAVEQLLVARQGDRDLLRRARVVARSGAGAHVGCRGSGQR